MSTQTDGHIVRVLDNGNGTFDIVARDLSDPGDATQNYVDKQILCCPS
ncbi:hypothetical protein [Streptomyces sp. NBC_00576]|nr:hypothetical protein [Streptomyces sp. NBC_00576]WUB74886.1 hypothetical protein OG734_35235 [Streptomyces sp. NBC_00576]